MFKLNIVDNFPRFDRFRKPPFLGDKEEFIERAVKDTLGVRKLLSIEAISCFMGCDKNDIPGRFVDYTQSLKSVIEENIIAPRNESVLDSVDLLYQIWNATREIGNKDSLFDFARNFDSLDNFYNVYFGNNSPQFKSLLMSAIDNFILTRVRPKQIREIQIVGSNFRRNFDYDLLNYGNGRNWTPINRTASYTWLTLASEEVLAEAVNIIDNPHNHDLLVHSTSSPSLTGISKERAILSAREADRRNVTINTGERAFTVSGLGYSISGGKYGLSNIYADHNRLSSYGFLSWFDQYEVAFAVETEVVRARLEAEGIKLFIDISNSEGVEIGSVLPIEEVSYIISNNNNLSNLAKWARDNQLEARILSLEAWELLKRFDINLLRESIKNKPIQIA